MSNTDRSTRDDDNETSGGGGSRSSKRQCLMLDWRMDPEESRSDFVIEIAVQGVQGYLTTTYHVHKNFLAFGKTASVYFAGLFASQTAESNSNKIRIAPEYKLAPEAFPLLLDHLYGLDEGKLDLTITNAAPLYHLSDYFEVESLQPIVVQFWEENIQVEDLPKCLEQASAFKIGALRDVVVKKMLRKYR